MELKFLVADDEEVNRLLLSKILAPFGKVEFARNGLETLEQWERARDNGAPYNLILLDIMMPEMDGQEALSRIRYKEKQEGLDSGQETKVVMVTSLGDWDNALASFKKGVEEYITKPIERAKIVTLLENLKLLS